MSTASNEIGESEFSSEVSRYAAALPSKPAALIKGPASTRNQIELLWQVHPDGEIPVTGYAVEVDRDHFGGFVEIWNGREHPDIRNLVYSEVEQGAYYTFRYLVFNLNGQSLYSDELTVWACEAPSAPTTPTWITSDLQGISIQWALPTDDGGCPVLQT